MQCGAVLAEVKQPGPRDNAAALFAGAKSKEKRKEEEKVPELRDGKSAALFGRQPSSSLSEGYFLK